MIESVDRMTGSYKPGRIRRNYKTGCKQCGHPLKFHCLGMNVGGPLVECCTVLDCGCHKSVKIEPGTYKCGNFEVTFR
jgi:hypothetical protein